MVLLGSVPAERLRMDVLLDADFRPAGKSDVADLRGCLYDQLAYVPEGPVQVPSMKSIVEKY